uniref:AAA family ATPase n=1 Tax=candidate division WOR-3 bacterium TaxID=2052148 RepID=A0A7C6AEW1_UNCW3
MDYLDEIIGQETAKKFIRNALKKDQIYNLLIAGPEGVGKRQAAFALAKSLGCPPHSPNFMLIAPVPSGTKEEKISEYMKIYLPENPVVHLDDYSSIVIKQIRNLIEWLLLMPAQGTKRIVIILEADRMNEESANSFLKTLEEPPMDTLFILTSSRPDFLLPTIRSRCQIVKFGYLSNAQIENIIFEGKDNFYLGSPGEILYLKENKIFTTSLEIFKKAPLAPEGIARWARELENENLTDFFYGLLLLYRCVLYRQLNQPVPQELEMEINKKAQKVSGEKIIKTILMLNNCINLLGHNPNHLILLFNTLFKLP